jgi:hypothetical protein
MAHVVSSSSALAFLSSMTEMHKSTSPSEMEVKKSAKDNQY